MSDIKMPIVIPAVDVKHQKNMYLQIRETNQSISQIFQLEQQ